MTSAPGAVRFLEPVDAGDMRVIQRRQGSRLALEAHQAIRVAGKRFRQDLERHLAPEFGVAGAIHLAHAAFAQLGEDVVRAETGAGGEGHAGALYALNV
jgi:hypothetical protein